MLSNGLGHLIHEELHNAKRFIDLFSGSGAVARHAATNSNKPVIAHDLQHFCVVLASAIVARNHPVEADRTWTSWADRARDWIAQRGLLPCVEEQLPKLRRGFNKRYVEISRRLSAEQEYPVTRSYGGYYFSVQQSVWLDALRSTLPDNEPERSVALAALIHAASQCAASPGHTAQPFGCTRTAKKFLFDSWNRSVAERTRISLINISRVHAQEVGSASIQDANEAAAALEDGDLVFLDPPYSGVHYSRFYHVLETVARGECGPVEGTGRYPPPNQRPRSRYSVSTESATALNSLLKTISSKGAKAILTFPKRECSNGLSGRVVEDMADKYFKVRSFVKKSTFSTLGGTKDRYGQGYGRTGRQKAHELVFTLIPR